MTVAERLDALRERIAAAVGRRGPGPEVRLVGIAKHQPIDRIVEALDAGLGDVGENYAQELRDKTAALAGRAIRWHFVGALQTNKIKHVVGCALIHSVDRLELAEAIHRRAAATGHVQAILLQVNLAAEPQKSGVAPDRLPNLLEAVAGLEHLRCVGLMVLPPADADSARRDFAALRRLRDRLAHGLPTHVQLDELSMGMSDDFEAAIEAGATLVRIGTALFGARPTRSD